MDAYRNARGEEDYGAAMMAHLDPDELAPFENVVSRQSTVKGAIHQRMSEVLFTFRQTVLGGRRNEVQLDNMVRELFGENTGDAAARELAIAWREASDYARLRFNDAGGRIARRDDWGLPQSHDSLKVRQVDYATWRDFIAPKLDMARMVDDRTGLPFTSERLELALKDVFETIRTEGWSKKNPSGAGASSAGGGKALANRRLDHRFLVFKDADTWMAYNERFGETDPFSAMVSHIDGMARDIAMMEVLGPNPSAMLRWMEERSLKQAALRDAEGGGGKSMDSARSAIDKSRAMYDHLTGKANAPIHGGWGRTFAGLRHILQSAQLGSAAISAITDLNFQRIAAAHNGLPQAKVIARVVKLLASEEDRKLAVRLGLIAENWSSVALGQQRFVGDVTGPAWAQRMSTAVMNLSGLSPWTQAGRWAFGMEFMGHLADQAGKRFDALDAPMQDALRRYGIGPDGWDAIRKTDLYDHQGATFLRPDDIALREDLAPDLRDRLSNSVMQMIQTEMEYAVPSSSLRGKVMLLGDAPPGTWRGEFMRSSMMYKNFAVTLLSTHVRRAALQARSKTGFQRGTYAMNLVISTTVMGALAMQLKDLTKGRDPRAMDNREFWGAALLQGGGLGIFGDLLTSDVNRFGGGLAETLAGPVVSFANDVRRLTIGNAMQLGNDEDTRFGAELTHFLRRYTPGGSLWYARLGYERLLLDRLQLWTDPKARRSFRARESKLHRETGQRSWWRQGRLAPDRAPDFSNVSSR